MGDELGRREPGGFVPETGLPSPAPSSATSRSNIGLPHPRGHSLRPGSSKEDMVRRFVEQQLLAISRRYVKKFSTPLEGDIVTGFNSFSEVSKELEEVVDVLWKSGTPSLQIPFLLKVASDFTQYVRSFPPAPKATFRLLRKLDHCFASLLRGQDLDSEESLPGFENGLRAGMTTTDMIRCRSLVQQTRVLMVAILTKDPEDDDGDDDEEETEDDDFMDTDADTDTGQSARQGSQFQFSYDLYEERLHMDAARIYENTLVMLGERLGDPLGEENLEDDSAVCATA